MKMPGIRFHHAQGDLLVKAPLTAAAGIEPERAAALLHGKFMGMAVNDHIRTGQNYTFLPASEPTVPVTEAAGQ